MNSSRMVMLVSAIAVSVPVATAMAQSKKPKRASKQVARGEYLVTIGGCHDCHTPLTMGPQGPERDMSRMLSGHPEGLKMPPAPAPQGPWLVSMAGTGTAFAGPWGVSYGINLTPDKETGDLQGWTEQTFIQAMRTGKHMGRGRPILPPMPWQLVGKMTDADLKAVWAYLQSIPAVKNEVPEPTPPAGGPPGGAPAGGPPGGTAKQGNE